MARETVCWCGHNRGQHNFITGKCKACKHSTDTVCAGWNNSGMTYAEWARFRDDLIDQAEEMDKEDEENGNS